MPRKRKFKVGDEVELVGEHRYYGGVYQHEALDGDRMTVVELTTETWTTEDGRKMYVYICRNPARPPYDTLRVDEDCIRLIEEYSDDDILELFGVKPLAQDAHTLLHKHYLKDGSLECSGCSWKVPNRNGIRMKFADHLVDVLKKNNVLP